MAIIIIAAIKSPTLSPTIEGPSLSLQELTVDAINTNADEIIKPEFFILDYFEDDIVFPANTEIKDNGLSKQKHYTIPEKNYIIHTFQWMRFSWFRFGNFLLKSQTFLIVFSLIVALTNTY